MLASRRWIASLTLAMTNVVARMARSAIRDRGIAPIPACRFAHAGCGLHNCPNEAMRPSSMNRAPACRNQ
jgi:hypothetical protein